MGIALKTKGVVWMLIGILITIFGWFIAEALGSLLPHASLQAIFWVGIILLWLSGVVIVPILMIWGGKEEFGSVIKGVMIFGVGYIVSWILFYTVGYILEAMDAIWPNSTFVGIGWFIVYTIAIISMIIAPAAIIFKNSFID